MTKSKDKMFATFEAAVGLDSKKYNRICIGNEETPQSARVTLRSPKLEGSGGRSKVAGNKLQKALNSKEPMLIKDNSEPIEIQPYRPEEHFPVQIL